MADIRLIPLDHVTNTHITIHHLPSPFESGRPQCVVGEFVQHIDAMFTEPRLEFTRREIHCCPQVADFVQDV